MWDFIFTPVPLQLHSQTNRGTPVPSKSAQMYTVRDQKLHPPLAVMYTAAKEERMHQAHSTHCPLTLSHSGHWTLNIENWQWCLQLLEERMHPVYSAHCPLTLSHIGHEYWLFNTGHWILVVMYTADMHPMHSSHWLVHRLETEVYTAGVQRCTYICTASPLHPLYMYVRL